MALSVWADPGMGFVLGTPTTQGYVVRERRDDRLCATILRVQWEDRCSMTYRLTDEVRASCYGNLAVGEAVRTMVERHEEFHAQKPDQLHSPLCGTAHGAGTCPLCDVLTAKERIAAMTGVQNHTLVVPEWVAEWERRQRMAQDLKSATPREEAAAPTQPPARRYCPREG